MSDIPKTCGSLFIPRATVFISSFCIMVLELVAGRLIARHLGSSLYTWTSVIGVVLAGIAIGNFIGGRIADRFDAKRALAILFSISSATCVMIVILNNIVGEWIWLWHLSWPVRTFTHVSLIFLVPSILLGTISPIVAKMALDQGKATGKTVGEIYAWGTAGSILGTFMTGYYLVSVMGTTAIIWAVGGVLLLMGLMYWVRCWMIHIWMLLFLVASMMGMAPLKWAEQGGALLELRQASNSDILYEDESQYCYVAVKKIDGNPNHLSFIQDKLRHSEIRLDTPERLQYFYTKIYAAVTDSLFLNKQNASFMVIGGGGYVFPRYLEKYWPNGTVDVVEIDPGVTEGAMAAFGLSRDTKINTLSMDARNYVDELIHKMNEGQKIPLYDCIYEDAINDYSVPFQLVTKEFNEKISQILTDEGVYMVNLIDMYEPGLFMGAIVSSLEGIFPYISIATEAGISNDNRNTFVIVCSKKPFDIQELINKFNIENNARLDPWCLSESEIKHLKDHSGRVVLTDDFAPVENLLTPVVQKSATDFLATKYMNIASDLKKKGEWSESIQYYENAVNALDRYTFKAYNEIGMIYALQKDWIKAKKAFETAIEYKQSHVMKASIGSIYLNYGLALTHLKEPNKARDQFQKSINAFEEEIKNDPTHTAYTYLGNAHATLGDFISASQSFSKALKMQASNPEYYDNLVKSLEYQGRYEEAIAVLQQLIKMLEHFNQNTQHVQAYINRLEQKKEEVAPNKN